MMDSVGGLHFPLIQKNPHAGKSLSRDEIALAKNAKIFLVVSRAGNDDVYRKITPSRKKNRPAERPLGTSSGVIMVRVTAAAPTC